MRRWLLPLVTAMTLGLMLVPVQPAGAALDKTGFWIGSCVGEMDVVVSNKPSFTSLVPNFTASINDSGLLCVIASLDYSGTTGELLSVNLGNVTPVTCEAGL